MTEHGPNPLEIGGGLYLKTGESPVRLALGLGLHDGGQTWHWGKRPTTVRARTPTFGSGQPHRLCARRAESQSDSRCHTVDTAIGSERAVRDVAVSASPSAHLTRPFIANPAYKRKYALT